LTKKAASPPYLDIPNNISIGSAVFAQLTTQSLYALHWAAPSPSKPFAWENWTPVQYMLPLANPSPQPKRHLDRFSHFCRAHDCDIPTDRPLRL